MKRLCAICHKHSVYGKQICCAHCLLEKHLGELHQEYVKEYQFHKTRKWRFDFLLCTKPECFTEIAVEIEGGIFAQGRHVRGKGFQQDMNKYNVATMMGYRILRFSTEDVERGRAKAFIQEHLKP